MVSPLRLSLAFRREKAGRDRPGLYLYANWRRMGMGALALLGIFGEGGVHFILLDASPGVAGLAEILLLGAVTHHAGWGLGSFILGLLGSGLLVIGISPGAAAHRPTPRMQVGSASL